MCELDSHANTCVAGANCIVLEETNQPVDVTAFSEHLDTMKNVPIVTAATAYDDPGTGITYILILGKPFLWETKWLTPSYAPTN